MFQERLVAEMQAIKRTDGRYTAIGNAVKGKAGGIAGQQHAAIVPALRG
jgi:hypothetical protein